MEDLAIGNSKESNQVFKGLSQPSRNGQRKEESDLNKVTFVTDGSPFIDV